MKFATKDNFKEVYRYYIVRALSRPAAVKINIKMPTPLPNKRTMGR